MTTVNASDLPRIVFCNGSVALTETLERIHDENKTDSAKEGTAAHWIAEQALAGVENWRALDVAPNGWKIDDTMRDAAELYYARVVIDDRPLILESRVDFHTPGGVEIKCRNDVAKFSVTTVPEFPMSAFTLDVVDLKYGYRIVEPEDNWQLVAQAVGILIKNSQEYIPSDVERVRLSIFQPRPYHPDGPFRTWEITIDELRDKWRELCAILDNLADNLNSSHLCGHCPGAELGRCGAYLRASYNAIDVAMSGSVTPELPDAALPSELSALTRAAEVINQRLDWIKDDARRRITSGRPIPGWQLKERFANSTWKDIDAAKTATNIDLMAAPKPCTPAEAKRRGASDEFIAQHAMRPPITPELVRHDPDATVRKALKKGKKK